MTHATLIHVGGCYLVLLAVFHVLFWRIFDWKRDLRSLSFLNRAIVQALNVSLTGAFLIFAWVSLRHADALLATALGRDLLTAISLLFLARAVQQAVFFRLRVWGSWAFLAFFLLGTALYGIPAASAL